MYNQVRIFEDQPVRLWVEQQDGRYAIWADGLMRWFHNSEIAAMPVADKQQVQEAFPVQDIH